MSVSLVAVGLPTEYPVPIGCSTYSIDVALVQELFVGFTRWRSFEQLANYIFCIKTHERCLLTLDFGSVELVHISMKSMQKGSDGIDVGDDMERSQLF
jgi:hypothetical protein